MAIAGSYVADNSSGDPEVIVNEINSVMPDVVLSMMDQPFQEEFLYEQKPKIGAKLWFGLVPEGILGPEKGKGGWIKRLIAGACSAGRSSSTGAARRKRNREGNSKI